MAEKRSSLFELYPTDLERHLFTLRSSRPSKPHLDEAIAKRIRQWWLSGWSRWKSALTALTSF